MKTSKIGGAALILVGIGLFVYWLDMNWWHPTRDVLQMRANQADYGGIDALTANPTKIYLPGAFAACSIGGYCLKQ
jgi:hypothetical protein